MQENQQIDCRPDLSSNERYYPVLLHLSGVVRTRLRRFFNRREFSDMRPSDVIGILLDREEVYPDNIHSYAAKPRPVGSGVPNTLQNPIYTFENSPQLLPPGRTIISYGQNPRSTGGAIVEHFDNEFAADGTGGGYMRMIPIGGTGQHYSINNIPISSNANDTTNHQQFETMDVNAHQQNSVRPNLRQWTSILRRQWYSVVVKFQNDGRLHCRICDTCMEVVVRGVGLRAGNAFDHVCKHLNQPLFVCRICRQQTVSSVEMRDHIRTDHHADARTFVDFICSNQSELEEMIVHCFETPTDDASTTPTTSSTTKTIETQVKAKPKRKRRREIPSGESSVVTADDAPDNSKLTARQLCYQMIVKWQRNDALYCRQCDQWLRVGAKNNWLRSETALQHICGHLKQPLFKCMLCPQSTFTSRQIRQHLQTVHKSAIRGQYKDLTESMQAELKELALCCFDWTDEDEGPPAKEGRFLRARLRSGLESNEQRRQALSECRHLIQSNSSDNRVQCQSCGTTFVARTANGYPLAETVYNHSLKHLVPGPYACRLCPKRTHTVANMRSHIWSKHKGVEVTEFEDYTGELHEEIMATLRQCFGGNVGGSTETVEQNLDTEQIEQQGTAFAPESFSTADTDLANPASTADGMDYIGEEESTSET